MADYLVDQQLLEIEKKRELCNKATDTLAKKVDDHKKLQESKFEKYLNAKSRIAKEDIIRLELQRKQQILTEAEQQLALTEKSATDGAQRVKTSVVELTKIVAMLRKSRLESAKEQSLTERYQNLLEMFSEMHTSSRLSQRSSLVNDRLMLEEEVSSITRETSEVQNMVCRLRADLDATGYEGLLHSDRRCAMIVMKVKCKSLKSELVQLRLSIHALRIRARSAQSIFALEK